MKSQQYTPHIFAISALFTLGNAIVIMNGFNLVNIAFLFGLSLVIIWLVNFLLNLGQKNKAMRLSMALSICAVAIYGAVVALLDYIVFLKEEQMPQTSVTLLIIMLLLFVSFFAASKTTAIYKYILFVFVIAVIIIVLCFVGGFKIFDYKNLNVKFFAFSFSLQNFLNFFSSIMVLPLAFKTEFKGKKIIYLGVMAGYLLLLVASLQVAVTLGGGNNIAYPYLKSVSAISSGSLFTRLDGLVWFLFFATSLIKITVCIKAIKSAINHN